MVQTGDTLAEINGIKPNVLLDEGDEEEVKGSGSSTYKIKRTFDHYYCTCPAWRNQKGVRVEQRSCKHLVSLLGEEYEIARMELMGGEPPKGTTSKKGKGAKASATAAKANDSKKPASTTTKSAGGKRKKDTEEDEDNEEGDEGDGEDDEEDVKPKAKKAKTTRTAKPVSKGKGKKAVDEDAEMDEEDKGDEEDVDKKPVSAAKAAKSSSSSDELAEINGIKPKEYLADGDEKDVKSMTSSSVYKVKRTWDHYYCTCPAWRNQGGVPVNARSCKHLVSILGQAYETERLKLKNPDGPAPKAATKGKGTRSATKPVSSGKGKGKRAGGDDDENDDEDEDGPPKKKARKPRSKKGGDEDEEGENEDSAAGGGTGGVPELLLANKWDLEKGPDPTGWWMSEKLDGVRCFYDGQSFVSRLGNPFTPPKWFIEVLPKDVTLDGELFGGRGEFQSTVSIVKTMNSPHWQGIKFMIFDVPSHNKPFEDRMSFLKKLFGPNGSHKAPHIEIVEQKEVKNRQHVFDELKAVETLDGEGLMLRKPGSMYEGNRSSTLLKVKTFYDAEAVVTGYVEGKGRNKGVTGALKCKMESGKTFNVGTGLNDKQRKNPPKIGSIIVYRFQELTRDNVPRFPSFIGEAFDKKVPKDAVFPDHKKAKSKAKGDDDEEDV